MWSAATRRRFRLLRFGRFPICANPSGKAKAAAPQTKAVTSHSTPHFASIGRSLAMWSAATCRRFRLLRPGRFPICANPQSTRQDKSGCAANESCDKSQHSTFCFYLVNAFPDRLVLRKIATSSSVDASGGQTNLHMQRM
jgi:hypothetical protein